MQNDNARPDASRMTHYKSESIEGIPTGHRVPILLFGLSYVPVC